MNNRYVPLDAVIIDAVRTPMGKTKNGIFKYVRAEKLSAHLIQALQTRNPNCPFDQIDDIIWGCVKQTKEQGLNIGRSALLLAGLPHHIPGQTVNRLCGSSMQALHCAVGEIRSGNGHIFITGGVEHMSHIPMDHEVDINPEASIYSAKASNLMGITAEILAKFNNIERQAQDEFALRSQQKAAMAHHNGDWNKEIIPTEGHDHQNCKILCRQDETIRFDANLESLSALKPVFDTKGTITAGSSSAMADGASALLIMSGQRANDLNLTPRARIRATSVAGCDPALMGRGPVPATKIALERSSLKLEDMQTIEINEAFAAQTLSVLQELQMADNFEDKVNLHGGAIALGHPLGCSGTRIIGTLLNIMEKKQTSLGLATMCIGQGQGIATIIEII